MKGKLLKTVRFDVRIGTSYRRTNTFKLTYRQFVKVLDKYVPRPKMRQYAEKFGLPRGGDKIRQINALWNDDRRLTMTVRVGGVDETYVHACTI